MIRLIRITNPLLPAQGRIDKELEHQPLQKLPAYLEGEAVAGCEVSLNGRIWEPQFWPSITLLDGDSVVISPNLEGSGFLRTLASVAVIGASISAFFVLGPLGSYTAALVAGAISAVGSTLVNVFMGPAPPSSKAETPSYAFSGPSTLAHAGSPIPRQYGRFLGGGCVIEQFTDIEGANTYINALVCYGFGPALVLNALQLNGKDVSLYQNVNYYFRTGTNTQTPVPGFGRIVNGYAQDTKCLSGQPVVVPGTGTQTQALQVDVQFPQGVFRTDSSGNVKSLVITYLVEYSVAGANDWQPVLQPQNTHDLVTYNTNGTESYPYWCAQATDLPAGSGVVYSTDSDSGAHYVGEPWNETQTVEVFQPNGNHSTYSRVFHGEWQKTDPTLNQVVVDTWTQGYVEYIDNRTSVLYNRTSIYGLAPNKYDVRITKYGSGPQHENVTPGDNENPRTGEQVWVHNVNEITFRTLSYPNMVLVGVRALATNQLSGGDPQILADISMGLSMPMPSELAAFPADNPACIAVDMMTSPVYGGGADISLANIIPYIDQWVSWAQLNEELVPDGAGNSIRRHPFNGIFDTDESLWSQLSKVGQMSRASLLQIGVNYGVFVDQPDVPVQMFSMGNIIKDSFQESYLALDDRATQVDVEFADFTRSYRTDSPVTAIDPADIDNGVILKPTRIKLVGCTVPGQAWHNANFRLQSAKKMIISGQFGTALAAIACRPGNLVLLQHDVPAWGWGGRTLPGSTTTKIVIDRSDIPWGTGAPYNMLVLQPGVLRYAGTVTSTTLPTTSGAAVPTLLVSNYDGAHRVTRMVINGIDRAVTGSGIGIITVEGNTVFGAAGATYELYDTDVIDTQAVANVVGNVVTLATPLQADPGPFATYIYGPAGQEAQQVRVMSIRRTDETHCQVEWAQYAPDAYIDGIPSIGATLVASAITAQVSGLLLVERNVSQTGGTVTYAVLSWKNGTTTVGVDIYGVVDGSQQRFIARVASGTQFSQQVSPADSWTFTVVGYDAYDDFAPMASAPTATINAVGPVSNLLMGANFAQGFAAWSKFGRPEDSLIATSAYDGEAVYTVGSDAMTAPTDLLFQYIPRALWQPGQYLLLSAQLSVSAGCTGYLVLIVQSSSGAYNGSASNNVKAYLKLSGASQGPVLITAPPLVIVGPTSTISVSWTFRDGFYDDNDAPILGSISAPAGATFTLAHPLLEIVANANVTTASPWTSQDIVSQASSLLVSGSSTGLRTQGSAIPGYVNELNYAYTSTTITISWTGLAISWRDGSYTTIPDGSIVIGGLTASTMYYAFIYYDVVLAQVELSTSGADSGASPFSVFSAYNAAADAACYLDNRVPLAPGGLAVTTGTAATGGTGGSSGGTGTGSGGGTVGGGRTITQGPNLN